jgi:hypothetical protein
MCVMLRHSATAGAGVGGGVAATSEMDAAQVPEGLVAVCRNNTGTGTLRVVTIDRLGEPFKQKVLKLTYTPRKLLVDAQTSMLVVIEADKGMQPLPHRTDLQVQHCTSSQSCATLQTLRMMCA